MEKQLKIIRSIQTKYPDCHVGGSLGLFLQGIKLKRLNERSDIDIVKFFDNFTQEKKEESESTGDDFNYSFKVNDIRVDINIDPYQTYEQKWYQGFQYRVSTIENILKYKMKYADEGNEKHKRDVEEISLKFPALCNLETTSLK